jgi:hypothetical protein
MNDPHEGDDQMTSREVEAAAGLEGEDLEAQREALRHQVAEQQAPAEKLARVEQRIQERDAAKLQGEAKAFVLASLRAVGSLAASLEQDDLRILGAGQAYARALGTLVTRFVEIRKRIHAAAAVAEVFKLPAPDFPAVVVPAMRDVVGEAGKVVAAASVVPDHGYVPSDTDSATGARTYRELDGDAAALVQRALALKGTSPA